VDSKSKSKSGTKLELYPEFWRKSRKKILLPSKIISSEKNVPQWKLLLRKQKI